MRRLRRVWNLLDDACDPVDVLFDHLERIALPAGVVLRRPVVHPVIGEDHAHEPVALPDCRDCSIGKVVLVCAEAAGNVRCEDGYRRGDVVLHLELLEQGESLPDRLLVQDRKSTRLNSSHMSISYAVFCLKKKKKKKKKNN